MCRADAQAPDSIESRRATILGHRHVREGSTKMQTRTLGQRGPLVSALGLGCMSMSQHYGARDDDESIRAIHRALDLGVTFFDTAAIYGDGHNETVVGRGLGARRKQVVLATKCGIVPLVPGPGIDADGSPKEIVSSCEASLRRLGTDVIDLVYLHRVDPKVPIEESGGALAFRVRGVKGRHVGLSEALADTMRLAQWRRWSTVSMTSRTPPTRYSPTPKT